MIIPLMIIPIIPDMLPAPVTIEIAFETIFIMDKMMVTVQAHLFPFSSPYETMKCTIPIAINTPPITMAMLPKKEGGIPERGMPEPVKFPLIVTFPSLKAEGGSEETNVPARTARMPIKSVITPTMIVRIAIIVTPVGRDLGVLSKI
jgi:hypothetical protein